MHFGAFSGGEKFACEVDFRGGLAVVPFKGIFWVGITLRLEILAEIRNSMRNIKSELDFRGFWLLFLLKTFLGGGE